MNEGNENDDLEQRYAKRLQELEERYELKFAAIKNKTAAAKNEIAAANKRAEEAVAAKAKLIVAQKIAELKRQSLARSVLAVLKGSSLPPIRPLHCVGPGSSHLYTEKVPALFTQQEFVIHDVYSMAVH